MVSVVVRLQDALDGESLDEVEELRLVGTVDDQRLLAGDDRIDVVLVGRRRPSTRKAASAG